MRPGGARTWCAVRCVRRCASEAMQILGGAGYLRGNAVERIYREVMVMAIGGGSEEIMRDWPSSESSSSTSPV